MTGIKKILALLMVIVLAVSVAIVGTAVVSAKDTQTSSAGADAGITIHYKSADIVPYVYYWNSLPTNIEVEYPGVAMTKDAAQGDDWYTYTFNNVTKINFLITDKNGNQLTKEFTRNTGEWWHKNGIWRNSNPDNADPVSSIDFREDTIYFVMTTRFYNGDESNDVHCWDDGQFNNPDSDKPWRGDFKGLAEKLDYIKALGFSAIWITPVVENGSGYDYHGYHAMDFSKVDPRYESDDFTFQDLIDAAHAKGMKIVQDVVLQHTGNFGENTLCPLFTKDYSKDLGNIEESMIPTEELLKEAGVKTAEEYWALPGGEQHGARLRLMKGIDPPAGQQNFKDFPDNCDNYTRFKTGVDYDKAQTNKVFPDDAPYNSKNYYHSGYWQNYNWDDYATQYSQIAGDCVDLNTENPAVAEYTVDAYSKYLAMGVDAFRVDTLRHISRLSLNMMYNEQLKAAGGIGFYMFGEACTRHTSAWYRDMASESAPFYTWKESNDKYANQWNWNSNSSAVNANTNLTLDHWIENFYPNKQPTSQNVFLKGIDYHTPDYSQNSGMSVIDFSMHWNFENASRAFGARYEDKYYNDASWNVVYVDSHDYGPDSLTRYAGGTAAWAENLDLMFTFRGIPCVYYGSEVEFMKGQTVDGGGDKLPISKTGRAYYGDYLKGDVSTTDFGEYTASGNVKETLDSTLSKHITKLNKIRRAIPALQKGQYTTESSYVSGNMAYIRRYTDDSTDSLACVSISGSATFKNIPNGTYIDAVTGDTKTVTNGTLTVDSIGKSNMRVYVCCANGFQGIDGAIGETGLTYLK